ncbi:MAG: CoA ester lyase [Chloroflexota bacterium]
MLFVPADRGRFYEKLRELHPDAVILDLEDAVAPSAKEAARSELARRLGTELISWLPVFVRLNRMGSSDFHADVRAAVRPGLYGVLLPKAESAQDLREANMALAQAELRAGLPIGSVKLVPVVETVRGVLAVHEIVGAAPRVFGVGFGAEDFSLDLGVERSREGIESIYPRAQVALAARAAGVFAFDGPWAIIDDQDGLRREAAEASQLGFSGKQAIHPSQIAPINAAFVPSPAAVSRATRVVALYEDALARGVGAVQIDGELIDVPMVERARRTLARATGSASPKRAGTTSAEVRLREQP